MKKGGCPLVPAKAQELIRQKAKAALEKRSRMKPFRALVSLARPD
jgi:hypothetical protein